MFLSAFSSPPHDEAKTGAPLSSQARRNKGVTVPFAVHAHAITRVVRHDDAKPGG
jgi:hypothetical protein